MSQRTPFELQDGFYMNMIIVIANRTNNYIPIGIFIYKHHKKEIVSKNYLLAISVASLNDSNASNSFASRQNTENGGFSNFGC
jgi:hypothetical protein